MKIDRRYILTTEELNRHGYWVMHSGIDIKAFQKNPIMFYDHDMDEPIGHWLDIRSENNQYTAMPDMDEITEDDKVVSAKVKSGTITAVSIGFRVLEMSEDPSLMKPGQKYPTITKCEIIEASFVNIPANGDCVESNLYILQDGKDVQLNLNDESQIRQLGLGAKPKTNFNFNNTMKQKLVALCVLLSLQHTEADTEDSLLDKVTEKAKDMATEKAKLIVGLALKDGVPGTMETLLPMAQANETAFLAWAASAKSTNTPPATPQHVTPPTTPPANVEGLSFLKLIEDALKGKSQPKDERADWNELKWLSDDPEGLENMKKTNPTAYNALLEKSYGTLGYKG